MKYLAPILSVLGLIAAAVAPGASGFVASHPTLSLVLASLSSILAAFAPQPHKQMHWGSFFLGVGAGVLLGLAVPFIAMLLAYATDNH